MSSEDQQQGSRCSPDCSPSSRASSHLRVDDRNIADMFAADLNAIRNGSEVVTYSNNDESGLAPHANHEESGSNQSSLHGVSQEFTNSNPPSSIRNAVENDNELENFAGGSGRSFFKTINLPEIIKNIGVGRHLESENDPDWFNLVQVELSSGSPMRSLETQVAPEINKRPQGNYSKSAISHQAEAAQPEPSSLVRKPQRHRTPTGEQAEAAQPEPSSFAVRKSLRLRTPTEKYDSSIEERKTPLQSRRKKVLTPDGKSVPTAEEELELRQLQGWINPMLDQLWQWATPALNDLEQGAKYYKRCFTGTPEIQNLSLKLGDAVELMGPQSSKYIGIVAEFYERHRREEDRYRFRYLDQLVHTVWLYLMSDIPKELTVDVRDQLKKKGLNPESALFISPHSDVNLVQKVRHSVELLSVEEYLSTTSRRNSNEEYLSTTSRRNSNEEYLSTTSRRNSNEYYLAGSYDLFHSEVNLVLRGNFSLPEFLCYDSLKQQALMGKRFIMPKNPIADWYKS